MVGPQRPSLLCGSTTTLWDTKDGTTAMCGFKEPLLPCGALRGAANSAENIYGHDLSNREEKGKALI